MKLARYKRYLELAKATEYWLQRRGIILGLPYWQVRPEHLADEYMGSERTPWPGWPARVNPMHTVTGVEPVMTLKELAIYVEGIRSHEPVLPFRIYVHPSGRSVFGALGPKDGRMARPAMFYVGGILNSKGEECWCDVRVFQDDTPQRVNDKVEIAFEKVKAFAAGKLKTDVP